MSSPRPSPVMQPQAHADLKLLADNAGDASRTGGGAADTVSKDAGGERLFEWIRFRGGFVDPRQVVRNEASSGRGVYVTSAVRKGEHLASVPWDAILSPLPGLHVLGPTSVCGTIEATKQELMLGKASEFAPYTLLLPRSGSDTLPGNWSRRGLDHLSDVVGPNAGFPRERIAPQLRIWAQVCGGDPVEDDVGARAALLVQTRAHRIGEATDSKDGRFADCLVPLHDLYNHRNGLWTNVRFEGVLGGTFRVYASRDIEAGGQLYNSYNHRGVLINLSNFGFVEEYPQFWSYVRMQGRVSKKVEFFVDYSSQYNESSSSSLHRMGDARAIWNHDGASLEDAAFLQREYIRLSQLAKKIGDIHGRHREGIPEHEWRLIWQYLTAATFAIEKAIAASGHEVAIGFLYDDAGNFIGIASSGVTVLICTALGLTILLWRKAQYTDGTDIRSSRQGTKKLAKKTKKLKAK